MVRKLLTNRFVFAAVVVAFVLALVVSASEGSMPPPDPTFSQTLNLAVDPTNPNCSPMDPACGGSDSRTLAIAMDPTNPNCSPMDSACGGSDSRTLAIAVDPTNMNCSLFDPACTGSASGNRQMVSL